MYEIKPYHPDHLGKLRAGEATKEMLEHLGTKALRDTLQERGPSFSAFHNGELFMMAGINILWSGTGEIWAILGVDYAKHGFFIHRNAVKLVKNLPIDLGLNRLQAVVLEGHYAGIQWVDRLGFSFEGSMPRYFQGKTYLRYAKTWGSS